MHSSKNDFGRFAGGAPEDERHRETEEGGGESWPGRRWRRAIARESAEGVRWWNGRMMEAGMKNNPMPAPMLRRGTKDSRDKVQWLIAIRRCLRWSAMDEKKKTPVARRRHRGGGSGYCGVKFW